MPAELATIFAFGVGVTCLIIDRVTGIDIANYKAVRGMWAVACATRGRGGPPWPPVPRRPAQGVGFRGGDAESG